MFEAFWLTVKREGRLELSYFSIIDRTDVSVLPEQVARSEQQYLAETGSTDYRVLSFFSQQQKGASKLRKTATRFQC